MKIGVFFPSVEHATLDEMAQRFADLAAEGFASGWLPQSRSFDALTALAVIGREVPGIALGTAVVPTFPRHPIVLGTQALTVNAAVEGRLLLGIGLSHKMAVEGSYGISYDRPARHMADYLRILLPLLHDGKVDVAGETLVGRAQVDLPGAQPCPVLLAALQPRMLRLAGSEADGTITWCTGPVTLEKQIVPLITAAASVAGRPENHASSSPSRVASPTTNQTGGPRRTNSSTATAKSPCTGRSWTSRGRLRPGTCRSSGMRRK